MDYSYLTDTNQAAMIQERLSNLEREHYQNYLQTCALTGLTDDASIAGFNQSRANMLTIESAINQLRAQLATLTAPATEGLPTPTPTPAPEPPAPAQDAQLAEQPPA